MTERKLQEGACKKRPWYWLASKGHKPSKTAFWLFMVMLPTVVLLWVVIVRLAIIPPEFFTDALIGGGAFFTLITFLIGRLYHHGKVPRAEE